MPTATQVWSNAVVDMVSQPSTEAEPVTDVSQPNAYSADDSYGGYPFLEWEDLSDAEKAVWGASKVGAALSGQVRPHVAADAVRMAEAMCSRAWNITEARHGVAEAISKAHRDDERAAEAETFRPQAARPGHLMAEGMMLVKAKNHATGRDRAYERKVVFSERVNRFTCLKGDNLALGGDMLTGCTVTDTVEVVGLTDINGRPIVRHEAKAIST